MHRSLYNPILWHKTGSNQKLDSGKAWKVLKHEVVCCPVQNQLQNWVYNPVHSPVHSPVQSPESGFCTYPYDLVLCLCWNINVHNHQIRLNWSRSDPSCIFMLLKLPVGCGFAARSSFVSRHLQHKVTTESTAILTILPVWSVLVYLLCRMFVSLLFLLFCTRQAVELRCHFILITEHIGH